MVEEPEADEQSSTPPIDQSPAEAAYHASTELKHDENSLISAAPTADEASEAITIPDESTDRTTEQSTKETIADVQATITPASALRKGKGKEVFADVAELETALEIEADKAEADKSGSC